jgi:aminomethyltransferase
LAIKLLDNPSVNPAGLGARDSLRLEAGLCLYGHDIDRTINPVEAGLGWTISPRRRAEGGFLGAEHIVGASGKLRKATKKRVGIAGMKAPAREGTIIYDAEGGQEIGRVTSGTFSPTLKKPIAMGYVLSEHAKVDTPLQLKIRDKMQPAVVTKMPFMEPKYYRLAEE